LTSAKKKPAISSVATVLPTLSRCGPRIPEAIHRPSEDTAQRAINLIAKCCSINTIVPIYNHACIRMQYKEEARSGVRCI
jgi:hypothetical protein